MEYVGGESEQLDYFVWPAAITVQPISVWKWMNRWSSSSRKHKDTVKTQEVSIVIITIKY